MKYYLLFIPLLITIWYFSGSTVCSGHGNKRLGYSDCVCHRGFTGENCNYADPHNFMITGDCENSVCHCQNGWGGRHCSVRTFIIEQCLRDCTTDYCKSRCGEECVNDCRRVVIKSDKHEDADTFFEKCVKRCKHYFRN